MKIITRLFCLTTLVFCLFSVMGCAAATGSTRHLSVVYVANTPTDNRSALRTTYSASLNSTNADLLNQVTEGWTVVTETSYSDLAVSILNHPIVMSVTPVL